MPYQMNVYNLKIVKEDSSPQMENETKKEKKKRK